MEFNSINQDSPERAIGLQFVKVYNIWHNQIKSALKEIDLTHPQFIVLTSLGYLQQSEKEVTQVMVSKISEMDVMTVSQVLRILEKKDLINRGPHSTDTRAKALRLTDTGLVKMNQGLPIVEAIDQIIFGVLGEQESSFQQSLSRLIQLHEEGV